MTNRPGWILPIIVFSQFAGTSIWFAGNAVLTDLGQQWELPDDALASVTAAVQFGFIAGTLLFAFSGITDRFRGSLIFLCCAALGALFNVAVIFLPQNYLILLLVRFCCGMCLAGLYPVGMKIAAGWYQKGLGMALGFLVAALVLGTAFPHLLSAIGGAGDWQHVFIAISILSLSGGILMFLLVPDGPNTAPASRFNPRALSIIFSSARFRTSAFGYFGHMWELYAFWAFVPVFLAAHPNFGQQLNKAELSLWSFAIIAVGFLSSSLGGLASQRYGSTRVAYNQLTASLLCCLLSPVAFLLPTPYFLLFMLFWGMVVIGDSPQFSALNAANAPKEYVGSALTIVNCIGFSITIISIQLVGQLNQWFPTQWILLVLVAGPILGCNAMRNANIAGAQNQHEPMSMPDNNPHQKN